MGRGGGGGGALAEKSRNPGRLKIFADLVVGKFMTAEIYAFKVIAYSKFSILQSISKYGHIIKHANSGR